MHHNFTAVGIRKPAPPKRSAQEPSNPKAEWIQIKLSPYAFDTDAMVKSCYVSSVSQKGHCTRINLSTGERFYARTYCPGVQRILQLIGWKEAQ